MYNNSYDYERQQQASPTYFSQMDGMQGMGYQMPMGTAAQTPFYQTPSMQMQQPMQQPWQQMEPIQPMMPMGTIPDGSMGTTSGTMPTNIATVPLGGNELGETPVMDIEYTQGWLRSQIGKHVKIEFLIGTNMLIDREGTLVDVGISYVIINETETDDLLLCDIYSIKFVRVYQ